MHRLLALTLLFASCQANDSLYTGSLSEKNVDNMARLSIGMDEFEVLQVMRRPYSQETVNIGADSYELWYYVTKVTGLGQSRMVAQNLTPLAFKNGVLIGWGYDYYRWLMKKEAAEQDALEDKKLAPQTEDKSLEKALSMSKKPPAKKEKPPEEKKPPLKPEDKEMIEEESEQNFDYW